MIDLYDVVIGEVQQVDKREILQTRHKVLLVERYPTFGHNNFSSAGMTLEPLKEFDLPDSVIGSYWKDITIQCTEKDITGKEF